MFQAISLPNRGMDYWKAVLVRNAKKKVVARKQRVKRVAEKGKKRAAKSFRKLVALARQDRLKSDGSTSRESIEYKAWRTAVMQRDGYRCVKCGSKEGIVAHHIKMWAHNPGLRLKASNGVTLCRDHHGDKHDWLRDSPEQSHLRSIAQEYRDSVRVAG